MTNQELKTEFLEVAKTLTENLRAELTAQYALANARRELLTEEMIEATKNLFGPLISENPEYQIVMSSYGGSSIGLHHPVNTGIRSELIAFDFDYSFGNIEPTPARNKVRINLGSLEMNATQEYQEEIGKYSAVYRTVLSVAARFPELLTEYFQSIQKMRIDWQADDDVIRDEIYRLKNEIKTSCFNAVPRVFMSAGQSLDGLYPAVYMKDQYYKRQEHRLAPSYIKSKPFGKDQVKVELLYEADPQDFPGNTDEAKLYTKTVKVLLNEFRSKVAGNIYDALCTETRMEK